MGRSNLQANWLELSEASRMLGVHFSTLRRWADAGKVPCIRTPGGQRRFAREEIERLISQPQRQPDGLETLSPQISALTRAPDNIPSISPSTSRWLSKLDQEQRRTMRRIGQRMMILMMQYNSRVDGGEAFLGEAEEIANLYGGLCQQTGLSIPDTLRIFLLFQESILCALYETSSLAGGFSAESNRLYLRTHQFLDGVMIALTYGHIDAAGEPSK